MTKLNTNAPAKFSSSQPDPLVLALERLAREAGTAILQIKRAGMGTRMKVDGSPVTEADLAADAVIAKGLARLLPAMPIISEEADCDQPYLDDPHIPFILVDPLDGTREFVTGSSDYTVNIALIVARRPVLGVVHRPEDGLSWVGDLRGLDDGAWQIGPDGMPRSIQTRKAQTPLAVTASHSHLDPQTRNFLERLGPHHLVQRGSSVKFCIIAEGQADFYPRFGPTMEWDTAAGDAVLCAAGGLVLDIDRQPFLYGKLETGCRNGGFFALGDPSLTSILD